MANQPNFISEEKGIAKMEHAKEVSEIIKVFLSLLNLNQSTENNMQYFFD